MSRKFLPAAAVLLAAACSRRSGFAVPDLADEPAVAVAATGELAVRVPAYGVVLKSGEIEVNIEAADAGLVKPGQEAVVSAGAGRPPIAARVSRVLPGASAETGQALAWLTAPRGAAEANDFASAFVTVAQKRALTIPKNAVLIRDGATWAVRAETGEGGKTSYAPVAVATGEESDAAVEVLSGLRAGDRVVVQGGLGALSPDFKAAAGD